MNNILVPPQKHALLVYNSIPQNPNAPKAIVLSSKFNEIGRHSAIKLDTAQGKEISKLHATISKTAGFDKVEWVLEDKQTLNGTFVNHRKIHRHYLVNSDEIVFGGGPDFEIGTKLTSTSKSDCRYIFLSPLPSILLSPLIDIDETLMPPDKAEPCPICYEPALKRVPLSCHHTFCQKCIRVWSKKCQSDHKPVICPVCRNPVPTDNLGFAEIVHRGKEVEIQTLDPLLRKLGVDSAAAVKKCSIFKKWDSEAKDDFYKWLQISQKSPDRFIIFCALTDCFYQQIINANAEQLQNAVDNFGEKCEPTRQKLLEMVIYIIFHKIYHVNSN